MMRKKLHLTIPIVPLCLLKYNHHFSQALTKEKKSYVCIFQFEKYYRNNNLKKKELEIRIKQVD